MSIQLLLPSQGLSRMGVPRGAVVARTRQQKECCAVSANPACATCEPARGQSVHLLLCVIGCALALRWTGRTTWCMRIVTRQIMACPRAPLGSDDCSRRTAFVAEWHALREFQPAGLVILSRRVSNAR